MDDLISVQTTCPQHDEQYEFKLNVNNDYVRAVRPEYKMIQIRKQLFSITGYSVLNNYGIPLFSLREKDGGNGRYRINENQNGEFDVVLNGHHLDIANANTGELISIDFECRDELNRKSRRLLVAGILDAHLQHHLEHALTP